MSWCENKAFHLLNILLLKVQPPLHKESSHTLHSTFRVHVQRAKWITFKISEVSTCLSWSAFAWVTRSSVKLHPVNWLPDIFGCICSSYFHNIACYPIKFYQFSKLDEQLTRREEKRRKRGLRFPCVDLNDLTAITPKQTLGDNSCTFGQAYQLTAQFPEKTFRSPRHVTPMLLRRRCVWMCCHERGSLGVFIWFKRSCC